MNVALVLLAMVVTASANPYRRTGYEWITTPNENVYDGSTTYGHSHPSHLNPLFSSITHHSSTYLILSSLDLQAWIKPVMALAVMFLAPRPHLIVRHVPQVSAPQSPQSHPAHGQLKPTRLPTTPHPSLRILARPAPQAPPMNAALRPGSTQIFCPLTRA